MYMKHKWLLLLVLGLMITGCGTQYVYHGRISAECSDGEVRDHLIYWRGTDRTLWFDTADGSIHLISRCVMNAVAFDESEEGILFYARPQDAGDFTSITPKEPCGRILNADKVGDLSTGPLQLEIWCHHEGDFDAPGVIKAYLKASETPYEFVIMKDKAETFPGGAPKLECPD
jgi:hypothetical protein